MTSVRPLNQAALRRDASLRQHHMRQARPVRPDLVAPRELVVAVALHVGLADLQPRAAGQFEVIDA